MPSTVNREARARRRGAAGLGALVALVAGYATASAGSGSAAASHAAALAAGTYSGTLSYVSTDSFGSTETLPGTWAMVVSASGSVNGQGAATMTGDGVTLTVTMAYSGSVVGSGASVTESGELSTAVSGIAPVTEPLSEQFTIPLGTLGVGGSYTETDAGVSETFTLGAVPGAASTSSSGSDATTSTAATGTATTSGAATAPVSTTTPAAVAVSRLSCVDGALTPAVDGLGPAAAAAACAKAFAGSAACSGGTARGSSVPRCLGAAGLVALAFKAAGEAVPEGLAAQLHAGRPGPAPPHADELRVGDLVFFSARPDDRGSPVARVGMIVSTAPLEWIGTPAGGTTVAVERFGAQARAEWTRTRRIT